MSGPEYRRVVHAGSGRVLVEKARWCDGFGSRLRGFTFRRRLSAGEGLVLVEAAEGRASAGITMLFVFFALGVVWLDSAGRVVDSVVARPWRISYLPQAPARYILEARPEIVAEVRLGDQLSFG
ncbi:MAG: DUF192 domain-containing protein [Candidatus Promineifilaceae bacterium]